MYESEIGRFIRELRAKNPQIPEQQVRNRATWWDKPQDLETWRERSAANVRQPGYVYFPLPGTKPASPDPGEAPVPAPPRA